MTTDAVLAAHLLEVKGHEATETAVVPKAETATGHVDRMVHHRNVMTGDAMTTVEVLRTNEMVADRADLRTWVRAEDLRRAMLIVDLAAATQNVVLLKADTNHATLARGATAAVSLAKVVDLQLVEVRAVSNLDLRGPEADVHRSLVADQAGHPGLRDENQVHRLAVDHRLAEALRRWDHRGHNAGSHQAVAHLSETAARDVRKWDHHG